MLNTYTGYLTQDPNEIWTWWQACNVWACMHNHPNFITLALNSVVMGQEINSLSSCVGDNISKDLMNAFSDWSLIASTAVYVILCLTISLNINLESCTAFCTLDYWFIFFLSECGSWIAFTLWRLTL